jgi:hypothetical protein
VDRGLAGVPVEGVEVSDDEQERTPAEEARHMLARQVEDAAAEVARIDANLLAALTRAST